MLILQHEVWHYHAKNKLYPAFPGVLLQRGLIVDSKDQQRCCTHLEEVFNG